MGWRYRMGLLLIGAVVLIWVTSAEVTQNIFKAYRHPFVLTWLGAALLVVYLPVALIREAVWKCFVKAHQQTKERQERFNGLSIGATDSPSKSPLKVVLRKSQDLELQHILKKDVDGDLESEQGVSLLPNSDTIRHAGKANGWEVASIGFTLAPLWFLTEYLSNAALANTSVASATILSSTAGLFTLVFGTLFGHDTFNVSKAIAVCISIAGVVMTTFGNTSRDEVGISDSIKDRQSMWGNVLGLLSAVSYGLFTILLKKYAGEEGGRVDLQKMFGYMGLFTLCFLWWLVYPLSWMGLEPALSRPKLRIEEELLGNALLGSVLSDYFWAVSVVWTTPLVATLGMSLTIPLAMVADMMVNNYHYSTIYILGSIQVFAGFVIANLTDECSRRLGL